MRICVCGDVHWSQYSSILRKRSDVHSMRLENLVDSINWVEETAVRCGCSVTVMLGDFFDSSHLNAEEISALQHIQWSPMSHVFITGNHETNVSNLDYSTADLFNLCPDAKVISKPSKYVIDGTDYELCFLPYVLERDRLTINEYFEPKLGKRIVFSHNDLKDVNYGNFISPEGFELSDIDANCDMFLNGHIHHHSYITSKIINVGNITGQNFTEDTTYKHGIIILDTDDLSASFIENPYSINFVKLDCTRIKDSAKFESVINNLSGPHVLTIKVDEDFASTAREQLTSLIRPNILEYRIIVERKKEVLHNNDNQMVDIDHLKQFREYVLTNIGSSQLIQDELAAVLT